MIETPPEPSLADPQLPDRLAERLAQGTCLTASREFESELGFGRHHGPPLSTARAAAVLILLYPTEQGWCLPLTLRPATLTAHAGQISLPGGLVEPGEASQQAALRELQEELGVEPDGLRILGTLPEFYVFISDFLVTPWVAFVNSPPHFIPNPAEVAEVLEMPLSRLLDPASVGWRLRIGHGGIQFRSPHFTWGQHEIWRATSMILATLRTLLQDQCA